MSVHDKRFRKRKTNEGHVDSTVKETQKQHVMVHSKGCASHSCEIELRANIACAFAAAAVLQLWSQ